MKLLITSLYFLNDFQVHKNPLKLSNFLYQYDDILIAFIHTNLYHQNKINNVNNNLSLNKLEDFKPDYKGYRLKMLYYKPLLNELSKLRTDITEIKVMIPNDKNIQFNSEILLNEIGFKNYMLDIDNDIDIKREDDIEKYLDFSNFNNNTNIEKNLYQKLMYFQYRMDVSYFIKRTFLQKSTISLDTINLDTLLIAKILSKKYQDNLIGINLDNNEEKLLPKLRFLDQIQNNEKSFDLKYNYANLPLFIKINMDKDKIDLIKRKTFKKFNNINLVSKNNSFYINELEKDSIGNIEEVNSLTLNDLMFYLKKYNSYNNILWNLRQISTELEIDNNGLIINYFSNLDRLIKYLKNIDIEFYIDEFLKVISNKIKNKEDFDLFLKNEYKNYFIKIINDLNIYIKQDQKPIGICPICKKHFIYENEKTFFCMDCNFRLFKNALNVFKLKNLTRLDIKELLEKNYINKKIKTRSNKFFPVKFFLNSLDNDSYNLKIVYIKNKKKKEI